jgi:hypothetical protein
VWFRIVVPQDDLPGRVRSEFRNDFLCSDADILEGIVLPGGGIVGPREQVRDVWLSVRRETWSLEGRISMGPGIASRR